MRIVERAGQRLLREFFAGAIHRYRHMGIRRARQPQAMLQPNLARSRGEQIGTAHHVGNTRIGIVDSGLAQDGGDPGAADGEALMKFKQACTE